MIGRHHLALCPVAILLAVSCQAPPRPPQAPAAIPSTATAAPVQATSPAITPVAAVASRTPVATVRGVDECQTGPEFELSYAPEAWELRDTMLLYRAIPGCTLQLAAHGQQVTGPKEEGRIDLAGRSWQISSFPSEGLVSYWIEAAGGCYLFIAEVGPQAAVDKAEECQQAAEAVLSSFQLLGQSPH